MNAPARRAIVGRAFAAIFATGFIAAGVAGLVPILHTDVPADAPSLTIDVLYVENIGLFPVNILHTLVHWTFGLLAVAALLGVFSIGAYARGMAVVLAAFTVMGLLPGFRTLSGLLPLYGNDIWFHAVEALFAGIVGFYVLRVQPAAEASQPAQQ